MKEVCDFLGLMGYYRKFIQHYAHIALLLNEMCNMSKKAKKSSRHCELLLLDVGTVQFVWNGVAEEAFEALKNAIRKAPVVALPEERSEYVLNCDTSKYPVGAVLSQK
jgi:hypothetical protein